MKIQEKCSRLLLDQTVKGNSCRLAPENFLILVEHTPVYTIGIRRQGYSEEEERKLKGLGAEFYKTNRGGLITFHGPGQLVAYPIIHLKYFRMGMRHYIAQLEKTIMKTCSSFGIKSHASYETGVWVEDNKIAAIGRFIFVERWPRIFSKKLRSLVSCFNSSRVFQNYTIYHYYVTVHVAPWRVLIEYPV